ncbi:type II toxin-antitoxin system RelE/ParE family toxin [Caldichromatium japonicum]|uniref:Type II toxin-antitoxin system RelE/ParE family toxin n=1 Tax=Caldichromatium japonicum TaxID=2699430 RepID=A0A6G7VFT0_9GAMM|nr:type II toxin-antitoxin system RelE/ParE family toxin [Caldichromatium japonicum]QIK38881.1 type II toxin-antitoxin system RelE/ParE family toxin [Caldichromatium japonicum]
MAGELIWSRTALDDLEALATFTGRGSWTQARRLVEQVLVAAERLLVRAESRWGQMEDGIRACRIQGWSLLYERQGQDIHLLAIVQAPLSSTPARSAP